MGRNRWWGWAAAAVHLGLFVWLRDTEPGRLFQWPWALLFYLIASEAAVLNSEWGLAAGEFCYVALNTWTCYACVSGYLDARARERFGASRFVPGRGALLACFTYLMVAAAVFAMEQFMGGGAHRNLVVYPWMYLLFGHAPSSYLLGFTVAAAAGGVLLALVVQGILLPGLARDTAGGPVLGLK